MRYLLAIFIPPLAVFICKKPFQGIFNLILWLASLPLLLMFGLGAILWVICSIHALVVCSRKDADRRVDRLVEAIEHRNQPAVVRQ